MKNQKSLNSTTYTLVVLFLITSFAEAQTKRLKRPNSRVGVYSVDNFVQNSFDLYDKVYRYDSYAKNSTPLSDDDIDVLEDALDDLDRVSSSAPDIISDLDGVSVLKKGKATLQINRAKKALVYSIKTTKKLLSENKKKDGEETDISSDESSDENDEENSSTSGESSDDSDDSGSDTSNENASDNLEVYSKFDFVPGDKIIYFDDFSQDFIGDFPSKWNTNGTGEVVKLSKAEGKWFQMKSGWGLEYLPLIDNKLPDEYTIEFDLFTEGLDKQTSSTARMYVTLDDNNGFKRGSDYAFFTIPFGQYGAFGIQVRNLDRSASEINNTVTADIRNAVLNNPHISIAVNKKRFRLWINETKYVDIPQFIYDPEKIGFLKFNLNGLKDGKDQIFIQNLKIAEGGLDLRRTLMTEGRVSTNGILFDAGSATIQPQSLGIIRQISQVLMQDEGMNLNVIGHTDSDGNDDTNLSLSKARAEAVKNALITIYKISGDRLQTEGKGESEPIADNKTSNGKAKNRRVEFVRI